MNSIINDYDKEKILGFMHKLANQKMIFQSEAQFQHKLAMMIAKDITENKEKYEILLEPWTYTDYDLPTEKEADKRCYTDIVIMDIDKREYIAIELKYKTAEAEIDTDYGTIKLMPQGANDNGCYDYLLDIDRIQKLIYSKTNDGPEKAIDNLKECTCVGGYAIILTNEKKYWEYTNVNKKDENGYYMFCIGDDSEINKVDELKWMAGREECGDENNIRHNPINLKHVKDKKFIWSDYCSKKDKSYKNNDKFRYLCLEVKPKKV